jgi:ABC-type lipoprotein release transport system permease subunit
MGVGLVVLALMLASAALTEFSVGFSVRAILPLLALAMGVTLVATLVSAWPASRQRPLNVLRYE